MLQRLPDDLRNILRQAINPDVGYVTPDQVEERLHDHLEQWSNNYKSNHGSWSGVFQLE